MRSSVLCFGFLILSLFVATAESESYAPVVVPNGSKLPWHMSEGAKVFHLTVEELTHEFAPGLSAKVLAYNGQFPGPTIEAVEGDTVRVYVTNRLSAPTSVHWHGILLPSGMDGVSGLNQTPIPPGETYKYEFTLRQHGTHMYHSHFDEMVQIGSGATGLFIIHPRVPPEPKVDRDFALMLGEWRVDVGTSRPNPNEMTDFNLLTFNGKVFPATAPLVVKKGERVRIRVANLSQTNHHPIHLHGYQFRIVETDGGQVPLSAQQPETTVLTPVGTTRTVEFVADAPGDWALHCHMTHHVMNQMGHGIPNMLGTSTADLDKKMKKIVPSYMSMGQRGMGEDSAHMQHMPQPKNSIAMLGGKGPFGPIDMGGMFTVFKVREGITTYDDPGWYDNPPGTVAQRATAEELRRDLATEQPTKKGQSRLAERNADHHSH